MKRILSKSRFLNGIQCSKLLWTHYNARTALPPVDARTQAIFDLGHSVGDWAKKLFPDGIEVAWDIGFAEVLELTQQLMKQRKPLFEAGFTAHGTYTRVDVLDPVPDSDQWDIIEVKSGTSVGEVNHHDVALQRFCYEGAGVPIRRCFLMHINREYVRQGGINPRQLFIKEDITESVAALLPEMPARVNAMLDVIALPECPAVDIGKHCDAPYPCLMKPTCWAHVLTSENNVFSLRAAYGRDWELYRRGILRNDAIPDDFNLSAIQRIQVECERTNSLHVNRESLTGFLGALTYPLHFLDFETFGMSLPVPLLDGTRPYQQIPFQYSLHIQTAPGAATTHHAWLWDGQGDPRPGFMANLQSDLGPAGSIVVYNQAFELGRLKESAEHLPSYAPWVNRITERVVDLLVPFRTSTVYHPAQHGSASIKAVLPALIGISYAGLAISDGTQASDEFLRVTFGNVTAAERQQVRRDLEAYCGLDTQAMVDILQRLLTL